MAQSIAGTVEQVRGSRGRIGRGRGAPPAPALALWTGTAARASSAAPGVGAAPPDAAWRPSQWSGGPDVTGGGWARAFTKCVSRSSADMTASLSASLGQGLCAGHLRPTPWARSLSFFSTGYEFWTSLSSLAGGSTETGVRAPHQQHAGQHPWRSGACPSHALLRHPTPVLTTLASSATVACHLGPCAQHRRDAQRATTALAPADACWVPKTIEQQPTPILKRGRNFPGTNLEFCCTPHACYTCLLSTHRRLWGGRRRHVHERRLRRRPSPSLSFRWVQGHLVFT